MAVDTKKKRASVLGIVQPDGTIDQADRQTILWIYGGILAGEAVVVTTGVASIAFAELTPEIGFVDLQPEIGFTDSAPAITFTEIL